MTKKKLFLGLVLSMCFSVGLNAQESTQESQESPAAETTNDVGNEKGQKKGGDAEKKTARRKAKMAKNLAKNFSAIEMTEEQTGKLNELVDEHYESLKEIQESLDGLISKEDREKRTEAMNAAKEEGKNYKDAMKAGFEAIELGEEDQEKVIALNKTRGEIQSTIKSTIAEMLTDEQKELLAAASQKTGKGKRKGKGKGKGKKKKDGDGEEADDAATTEDGLVSVSISLPGMT